MVGFGRFGLACIGRVRCGLAGEVGSGRVGFAEVRSGKAGQVLPTSKAFRHLIIEGPTPEEIEEFERSETGQALKAYERLSDL